MAPKPATASRVRRAGAWSMAALNPWPRRPAQQHCRRATVSATPATRRRQAPGGAPPPARGVRDRYASRLVAAASPGSRPRPPGRDPQDRPHPARTLLRCAARHAIDDPVIQRPGQALGLRRAGPVDPFRFADLTQGGLGRADREEQVRVGVAAGGVVTPVRARSWSCSSPVASADDAEGEPRGTAAPHQPGHLMPVDAVAVDLGQRPGDTQSLEL